ncbi:hypothetical protein ASG17_06110 [Brevundimonas sp. Leaf363]|uniref:hypothetical protein n=1 Tax=Brevundimonas sp. Leaf363 TaxID=1736353 RepID=UPI0007007ED0|nr:hypothetical protein [Brevundimonas sp. Leaf363]KQS55639.1 hypothetical protein ASG17_06110 [Brevundimonas sp. Leaf363]
MSAFEFFFSFYGLLLGLSVAAIATGMAIAIQNRKRARIGWLTPLLAVFVMLDIASFWDAAWNTFRDAPFTYGLLIAGLAIALIYFLAASLVFPYDVEEGVSLDDHFWANKKLVLLLTSLASIVMIAVSSPFWLAKPGGVTTMITMGLNLLLYLALIVPSAFTRRRWLFAALVGAHTAIYLALAGLSAIAPEGPTPTAKPSAVAAVGPAA